MCHEDAPTQSSCARKMRRSSYDVSIVYSALHKAIPLATIHGNHSFFFCVQGKSANNAASGVGGAAGSVRLLLTKNPVFSFSCPSARVRGVSFEHDARQQQASIA